MTTPGSARIIRANSRHLPLADNTVDLIVTSPPYFALRSYQDGGEHYAGQIGDEPTPAEFVASLLEVTRECMRVLKPSGSLWVNLGDKYVADNRGSGTDVKRGGAKHAPRGPLGFVTGGMRQKSLMGIPWRYALACIDDLGLILRAEVIWSKPNGLPESVTDRVRRSHEQWFHFTLQPRYFSAVDEIREQHTSGEHGARRAARTDRRADEAARFVPGTRRGLPAQPGDETAFNPLGKLPGSVWSIPTEPLNVPAELGIVHFAAFPTEWPRRIIQGWSPAGVCVECGEGRRPVAPVTGHGARVGRAHRHLPGYSDPAGEGRRDVRRAITGYVCACNEPIATPVGRAGEADPSGVTGRGGFNRPRSNDTGTRVITRWEQRHEATQLRDSDHRDDMAAEAGSAFAHYIRTDSSGARPIPEDLRLAWRERGWLHPAPEFVPPATTPGVVLDPFGGTGTTALVAKALGRTGISVDMSADYCRLAEWRTNDPDQLAKASRVEKPPAQVQGQASLFEELA